MQDNEPRSFIEWVMELVLLYLEMNERYYPPYWGA